MGTTYFTRFLHTELLHLSGVWIFDVGYIFCFYMFLTRLCFVGRYLDSCDSIDFALGLHDYDLSLLQPHFPGYPVYMVASSLCFKLSHQDVWSLVMPGVLFGSITMYPLSLPYQTIIF